MTGSRTPSGWHDDAYKRDAGHDAMQMAVWLALKRRIADMAQIPKAPKVVVEFPMIRRGSGIVAFADIALLWFDAADVITRAVLYEIKPEIKTVFGILRQAICLNKAFAFAYPTADCLVEAVVRIDDQKLPDLHQLIGCVGWCEESKELIRYRPASDQQTSFEFFYDRQAA